MDKIMRLFAQSQRFESREVLLPSNATWLNEYIRELTSFPGSKYDDQVDSTTQALQYMKSNTSLEIWAKLGRGF
jgi:predicted phage terminase large subunit-like protein